MTMSACSCCTSSSCTRAQRAGISTSEQVVQIAEQIEEAETASVDGDETAVPGLLAVDERAPAAIDDVIDAVTSGSGSSGSAPESRN